MTLKMLEAPRAQALEALCELIVPGSSRVGPLLYIDALLAAMPAPVRADALRAVDALAGATTAEALAQHENSPEFAFVRALAIEAYYSDFVAPGHDGPGAWAEIGFQTPREADLVRDWSYLGLARP